MGDVVVLVIVAFGVVGVMSVGGGMTNTVVITVVVSPVMGVT